MFRAPQNNMMLLWGGTQSRSLRDPEATQ
eukprot:SAG11_NODE_1539_length_4722_cov_4.377028_1_plen_28_part_10